MSGRADSSTRSSVEPADAKPSFWAAIRPILAFGVCIGFVGFSLSLLGLLARDLFHLPWLKELSWWRIFRRCVSVSAALSLLILMRREHRSLRSFGFFAPAKGRRQFWAGLLLGLSMVAVLLGLVAAIGACRLEVIANHAKIWFVLLTFLPSVVLIGVLEELVFRGFILQHLLPYSRLLAVVLSSFLYAVVHVKTISWTSGLSRDLVGLFLLGGALALSFLQTHQLYFAVGLHAALAYGARINKLFVDFAPDSLSWLVGTSRLTDGLLNWTVLLTMGAGIFWWGRSLRSREVGHGRD